MQKQPQFLGKHTLGDTDTLHKEALLFIAPPPPHTHFLSIVCALLPPLSPPQLLQEFVNVYDYGCWNNWKVFLGIVNGRLDTTESIT